MRKPFLMTLSWFLVSLSAQAQDFWSTDVWQSADRGFLFYGPHEVKEKDKPVDLSKITTVEALHAERDRRLNAAIMDPTMENIAAYQAINTLMLEKSALFADMWRRSLWMHPQYDFTTQHPSANFAQVALKDSRDTARLNDIKTLAADWGLIVVIAPDCAYCDLMAPIAQKLTDAFGFEVLAINAGKRASAAWPMAKPDNGTLRLLMERTNEPITTTPTIFLVHRDRTRIHRVATGVVALEELIHRMHTVTSVPPGHSLFGGQP